MQQLLIEQQVNGALTAVQNILKDFVYRGAPIPVKLVTPSEPDIELDEDTLELYQIEIGNGIYINFAIIEQPTFATRSVERITYQAGKDVYDGGDRDTPPCIDYAEVGKAHQSIVDAMKEVFGLLMEQSLEAHTPEMDCPEDYWNEPDYDDYQDKIGEPYETPEMIEDLC